MKPNYSNDLTKAKKKANSLDDDWTLSWKFDILKPHRAKVDHKPKFFHFILEGIKRLEENFMQMMNTLQNRFVQLETNQQHTMFPPRNVYQGPPLNQIPLTTLEPTNILEHKVHYYCQAGDGFHDERNCSKCIEMMKASSQGDNVYLDAYNIMSDERKMFHLSQ
jgi:hypothetical protein